MTAPHGVQVTGPMGERYDSVLTPEALEFLAELHRTFDGPAAGAAPAREDRHAELAAGGTLDFLAETREIREADWRVAAPAPGLVDRRVEITGPTDRKMTINALNSGAKVWLADFEDANTPHLGQRRRRPAQPASTPSTGTIDFTSPERQGLRARPTTSWPRIVVRPRGWHLPEKHLLVDGEPMSGAWSTSGSTSSTTPSGCSTAGSGPVLLPAEDGEPPRGAAVERRLRPRAGRARHPARHHPGDGADRDDPGRVRDGGDPLRAARPLRRASTPAAGTTSSASSRTSATRGRDFVLPDRNAVTMTAPFMRAYTELLVAHLPPARRPRDRRHGGVHPEPPRPRGQRGRAGEGARRQDARGRRRLRRLLGGPPRPGADLPRRSSTRVLGDRPNQLDRLREDVHGDRRRAARRRRDPGRRSPRPGLRNNVSVGIQYLAAWLRRQRRRRRSTT